MELANKVQRTQDVGSVLGGLGEASKRFPGFSDTPPVPSYTVANINSFLDGSNEKRGHT